MKTRNYTALKLMSHDDGNKVIFNYANAPKYGPPAAKAYDITDRQQAKDYVRDRSGAKAKDAARRKHEKAIKLNLGLVKFLLDNYVPTVSKPRLSLDEAKQIVITMTQGEIV